MWPGFPVHQAHQPLDMQTEIQTSTSPDPEHDPTRTTTEEDLLFLEPDRDEAGFHPSGR